MKILKNSELDGWSHDQTCNRCKTKFRIDCDDLKYDPLNKYYSAGSVARGYFYTQHRYLFYCPNGCGEFTFMPYEIPDNIRKYVESKKKD